MTRQTHDTQLAATAAKNSADALINSERAWVMLELGWYENGLHITELTSIESGLRREFTSVNIKLKCTNAGRSPAWIDNIYWHLVPLVPPIPEIPDRSAGSDSTWLEPIGPGESKQRVLQAGFPGHRKKTEFITVYVVIEYHDIFKVKRETRAGYSIYADSSEMHRMDARPEWNNNT